MVCNLKLVTTSIIGKTSLRNTFICKGKLSVALLVL